VTPSPRSQQQSPLAMRSDTRLRSIRFSVGAGVRGEFPELCRGPAPSPFESRPASIFAFLTEILPGNYIELHGSEFDKRLKWKTVKWRIFVSDAKSDNGAANKSNPTAEELRTHMELLQSKLHAAKIAYFNGTELDGKVPDYEKLAGIAKNLISVNYQLQKKLYGKVRLKLSVSKLLRASSR
jgi:hypothetical protein